MLALAPLLLVLKKETLQLLRQNIRGNHFNLLGTRRQSHFHLERRYTASSYFQHVILFSTKGVVLCDLGDMLWADLCRVDTVSGLAHIIFRQVLHGSQWSISCFASSQFLSHPAQQLNLSGLIRFMTETHSHCPWPCFLLFSHIDERKHLHNDEIKMWVAGWICDF